MTISNLVKKKMVGEQQSCLEVEYGILKFFSCMFMNQHQQRKVETAVCRTGPKELGFLQNFKG